MVHGCRTGCGIVTTVSTVSNVSAGQTLRRADGADAAHIDRVSPLSQMSKLDRISSELTRLGRAIAFGVSMIFSHVTSSYATVLIRDDAGGPVGGYMQRYASIRDSGEDVVIEGQCLSVCTLVLALVPQERICLTPNAVFGFHAAVTRQERRYPRAGGAATRALWELYPEAIHNFIAQRGVRSSHMFI
jgi:hypothetical protein